MVKRYLKDKISNFTSSCATSQTDLAYVDSQKVAQLEEWQEKILELNSELEELGEKVSQIYLQLSLPFYHSIKIFLNKTL